MKLLLALLLLCAHPCLSQTTIKEIRQKNPGTSDVYVFPKISIAQKPGAAKKINAHLRREILDVGMEVPESRIFMAVWGTRAGGSRLYDPEYEVIRNDKSLLSLRISGEGCGAYCEWFDRYFSFDPVTGNVLTIDSLFTTRGLQLLADSLSYYKQQKILVKLDETESVLRSDSLQKNADNLEYYTEMKSLYQSCFAYNIEPDFLEGEGLYLVKGIMYFETGRCSAHVNQNVDELGTFKWQIRLRDWKNYLTPHGKKLFR